MDGFVKEREVYAWATKRRIWLVHRAPDSFPHDHYSSLLAAARSHPPSSASPLTGYKHTIMGLRLTGLTALLQELDVIQAAIQAPTWSLGPSLSKKGLLPHNHEVPLAWHRGCFSDCKTCIYSRYAMPPKYPHLIPSMLYITLNSHSPIYQSLSHLMQDQKRV
jgi:hypothetical protein